jgi:hypothetical protein
MKQLFLLFIILAMFGCYSGARAQNVSDPVGRVFEPPRFEHSLSLTLVPGSDEPAGGGGGEAKGEAKDDKEALAKATQNPVSDLISIPFQNNFNFGVGPNKVVQYILNVQPVIPIHITEDWNLITRTILPTINQPSPAPGIRSAFGLGDLNPSVFLSPAKPGALIWGVGPTATFPTATDSALGSGKWSAGPSVVLLTVQGHWVGGALANNQWSFAGWGQRNVNAMLIQPFVNYNLPKGWYLTTSPIITADWNANSDNRWTVPIGGGFGKIQKFGKLPINLQLTGYYNIEKPDLLGARWQLRAQAALLFPSKKKK